MDTETVQLDGAFGEGGGQIIRTSVALAALTGRPLEIVNIRARRSKPGLQAQHLTAVRAAAALCNAELKGAELGSFTLRFTPNALTTQSEFSFDVAAARNGASAGATGLVAQTLLVPMAFLPAESPTATILGGTHIPMAPSTDYIAHVYVPVLKRMGLECGIGAGRLGFFPKGGGAITLDLEGGGLQRPITWTERGTLKRLRIALSTALLPEHVAQRGKETLLKELKGYGVPCDTLWNDLGSNGPGAAVLVVAECENGLGGWTSLGERGKPMERVVTEAMRGFQKWFATGACVEEHLADQLVLPCALVPQESRWTTPEVTEHLRTVLFVTQQFLPIEYHIETKADGSGLVTLRGTEIFRRK